MRCRLPALSCRSRFILYLSSFLAANKRDARNGLKRSLGPCSSFFHFAICCFSLLLCSFTRPSSKISTTQQPVDSTDHQQPNNNQIPIETSHWPTERRRPSAIRSAALPASASHETLCQLRLLPSRYRCGCSFLQSRLAFLSITFLDR